MSGTCFVISPFGDGFDEYYDKIYRPAIERTGLQAIRADEVYGTGAVIDDIFKQIRSATLVLCDVTGRNPNVNYELGVAHAFAKPAVIVTQSVSDVPFDYKHLRAITYDLKRVEWAKQLEDAINKTVLSVLSQPERALAWAPKEEESRSSSEEGLTLGEIEISYTPDPSVAALRFRDQFVILGARGGDVHQGFRSFFAEIYEDVQQIQSEVSSEERVQLRKIWHDEKGVTINIWIDLIHNHGSKPTFSVEQIKERLHDECAWYAQQGVHVEARVIEDDFWSDWFFPNAASFYENLG
jgi:hypothetical protein